MKKNPQKASNKNHVERSTSVSSIKVFNLNPPYEGFDVDIDSTFTFVHVVRLKTLKWDKKEPWIGHCGPRNEYSVPI